MLGLRLEKYLAMLLTLGHAAIYAYVSFPYNIKPCLFHRSHDLDAADQIKIRILSKI